MQQRERRLERALFTRETPIVFLGKLAQQHRGARAVGNDDVGDAGER